MHHKIRDYLFEQGIVPKLEELTMGLQFLEGRFVVDHGLQRGLIKPMDQFNTPKLLFSTLNPKINLQETLTALRARGHVTMIDFLKRHYRKIARRSGLLIHPNIGYYDLMQEADRHVSYSCNIETPLPCGLYRLLTEHGDYDGLINACYFNCTVGMNAQTIVRKLANQKDIPFIAMDCESPNISTNQHKLLETLAIQAKSQRKIKNAA